MADDPIEGDLRVVMNDVGKLISDAINNHADKPMGFMLMTFDIGTGGRTSYISNVEREGVIEAMKEFLERQDGNTG
jgi:hypothetical protein